MSAFPNIWIDGQKSFRIDLIFLPGGLSLQTQTKCSHKLLPSTPLSALLTPLLHDLSCGSNPTASNDFFSAVFSAVSTLATADDAAAERWTLARFWSCAKRGNSALSSRTYDKSILLEYYLLLTNQSNRPRRPSMDKLWYSSALTYYAGEHYFYTQSLTLV